VIQLAGEVKARGGGRTRSFEHEGLAFNLFDTPGHQDFSPLGFQRGHLSHPDRGRQRGDGARRRRQRYRGGIAEQTRKLFEVCRLRDVPIIAFVNKLDREAATRSTCWTRSSRLWRGKGGEPDHLRGSCARLTRWSRENRM